MSVALCHYQTVLAPLEEIGLVQHFVFTWGGLPFHLHIDESAPLPILTKSGRFLLVGVEIDNQRKPKCFDLMLRKSIEIGLSLQVVVGCSVLPPLKVDLEL